MVRFRSDCITLHCTGCGWTASTDDGYGRAEVSRLAIEHYCRSGHTIVSDDHADAPQESSYSPCRRSERYDRRTTEPLL